MVLQTQKFTNGEKQQGRGGQQTMTTQGVKGSQQYTRERWQYRLNSPRVGF